ncbi:MAG TPA: efflux RND transporter permease subunit, partial [Rubrobacteraceae bacterium]|nr:efflux RND transporter permease subunit [Rubrobacteraceae bacterium]
MSLPSLLGLLLLIGIIFANTILLVDFATKARDDYDDLDEAVVAASRIRLRPILMTALATVFALLPLALGLAGSGSELVSSSLALTVIGGACDLDLSHVARRPGRLRPARRRPRSPEEEVVGVRQELRTGQGA